MPKRTRPIDRSTKEHEPFGVVDQTSIEWRRSGGVGLSDNEHRLRELLATAGIPEENIERAADQVSVCFGFHRFYELAKDEIPSITDEKHDLERLLDAASTFAEVCKCLSVRTRNRLVMKETEPSALEEGAALLAERARSILSGLPRSKGGRPPNDDLNNALFGLSVVFYQYGIIEKGIGRSGARKDLGKPEHKGPLLDMALAVLALEKIGHATPNTIGAILLDHDKRAKARALLEKQRAIDLARAEELDPPPSLAEIFRVEKPT